jgi:uncharacterized membrane protein YqjE
MPNRVTPTVAADPSAELAHAVKDIITHSRELVRAELGLAKAELETELRRGFVALGVLMVGAGMLGTSLVVVVIAVASALGATAWSAAAVGGALMLAGAMLVWWGQRHIALPRIEKTRHSLVRTKDLVQEARGV